MEAPHSFSQKETMVSRGLFSTWMTEAEPRGAIAAGDSFNDLGMIRASKAGFLFRSTEKIKADNPDLRAFEDYDAFLGGILDALG